MQKVDDRIRCALRQSADRCGSILALSRLIGVSHSTILFWLNGRVQNISSDIWNRKVFPVLEEDLHALSDEKTFCEIYDLYLGSGSHKKNSWNMFVPLIREEQFLSYRMHLENIGSFANREALTKICFDTGKEDRKVYFSVLLEQITRKHGLPWDVLVFFSENIRLMDGDLALIRFSREDFLRICRFYTEEKNCVFEDIFSGRTMQSGSGGELLSSHPVWAFPVAEIRFCSRKSGFFSSL